MEDMGSSVSILEGILQASDRIAVLLGDAWPEFRTRLVEILGNLAQAKGDELQYWVDELIDLGLQPPTETVFREILRQSQAEALIDIGRSYRLKATSYAVSAKSGVGPDVLRQAAAELSGVLMPQAAAKGLRPPRYLNAGFFATDAPLPTDQPLTLQDGPYRLGVNVGKFWGPGHPDTPIPEHLLQPYFEEESMLEMDVAVHSPDVEVAPGTAKLSLPREDDSSIVFFDLRFARAGRQAIDVDLLFRGHLLQSRRVEVEVVELAGVALPESAWPVQDGYVTFTRMATLDPDTMAVLNEQPRTLTIVAQYDESRTRIGLRFYNTVGADLGFQPYELTDANLTSLLGAVRGQLVKTMHAYTGGIGSTKTVLTKHLGQLADLGYTFYQELLPGLEDAEGAVDAGRRLNVDLEAGTIIQVARLSTQLGVPWELLYERPIESYREDRITLCSTFLEHGPAPEDCPSHDDPKVVCPHGFWGYRYIIEQLPCRVDPNEPRPPATLALQIRNDVPLRLNANVSTRLTQVDAHLGALRALAPEAQLELARADSLDGVKAALVDTSAPADIVYFYAHGGTDTTGRPYLEVGTDDQIKRNDLKAWKVRLDHHQPLVVLNACESADYGPDSFENLLQFFCDAGAAGVIGTQCEVKEELANTFIVHFFKSFLRQATGGQALFEARQALLRDYLDPRGLVYSLFASADVKLAQPIIV